MHNCSNDLSQGKVSCLQESYLQLYTFGIIVPWAIDWFAMNHAMFHCKPFHMAQITSLGITV